jgi:hypothetical protein
MNFGNNFGNDDWNQLIIKIVAKNVTITPIIISIRSEGSSERRSKVDGIIKKTRAT